MGDICIKGIEYRWIIGFVKIDYNDYEINNLVL